MRKIFCIALLASATAFAQRTTPTPLLVRCGTLIQPHTRQVLKNVAIQIVNGKIIRVGPVAEVRVPAGAQVLDFGDKYVIPGLVDLHAHTYTRVTGAWNSSNESGAAFLLAAGVTSARAPGSMNPGADLAMRNRIDSGMLAGPRYHFAGGYRSEERRGG